MEMLTADIFKQRGLPFPFLLSAKISKILNCFQEPELEYACQRIDVSLHTWPCSGVFLICTNADHKTTLTQGFTHRNDPFYPHFQNVPQLGNDWHVSWLPVLSCLLGCRIKYGLYSSKRLGELVTGNCLFTVTGHLVTEHAWPAKLTLSSRHLALPSPFLLPHLLFTSSFCLKKRQAEGKAAPHLLAVCTDRPWSAEYVQLSNHGCSEKTPKCRGMCYCEFKRHHGHSQPLWQGCWAICVCFLLRLISTCPHSRPCPR